MEREESDLSASIQDDSTRSNPLEGIDSNPSNNQISTSPKICEKSETEGPEEQLELESYEELKSKLDESNNPIDMVSNLLTSDSDMLPDQIFHDEVPNTDHDESAANEKELKVTEIEQQEAFSFDSNAPSESNVNENEQTETVLVEQPEPMALLDQQMEQTELVMEIPQITTQTETDSSYANNFLKTLNIGGLGLLSAYDSTDDSDASEAASVVEVPMSSKYRNQVIEIESNDSDDEECDLQKKRIELEKLIQVEDSDEEDGEGFKKQPLKVQGELMLEDLPPIEDLHITVPEQECIELGHVNSIIDQLLLVKTFVGTPLLDLGTVLFLEKGQKVLGEIFDVLGQVADPLYCIRFNNNQHIKEKDIKIGDKVYCAPRTEHTQLIILSNLTKTKGSDASWENDVEPPPKHVDYSDDEEEQAARRSRRMKSRNDYKADDCEVIDLMKKPRQQNSTRTQQNHPRQQSSYNYSQPNMPQQQSFNYQSEGNTWHSSYQPQFVINPYAMQSGYSQVQTGNFQQTQGIYQNQNIYQGAGRYQHQQHQNNSPHNGNYQSRSGYFQQQGAFQQANQQYQGQSQYYPQGNGGYL